MSLSIQTRSDDLDWLVRLAMQELGENDFDALFINAEAVPFNEIRHTTWEEAKSRRYLKSQAWRTFQFAEKGWLRGVELLNLTQDPAFAQKLSKLSQTLRSYVTPRPQEAQLVDIFTIASQSGLDHSFIYNAVSTRLIDTTYHRHGVSFDPNDANKHIIVVPIEYGLPPLPE